MKPENKTFYLIEEVMESPMKNRQDLEKTIIALKAKNLLQDAQIKNYRRFIKSISEKLEAFVDVTNPQSKDDII